MSEQSEARMTNKIIKRPIKDEVQYNLYLFASPNLSIDFKAADEIIPALLSNQPEKVLIILEAWGVEKYKSATLLHFETFAEAVFTWGATFYTVRYGKWREGKVNALDDPIDGKVPYMLDFVVRDETEPSKYYIRATHRFDDPPTDADILTVLNRFGEYFEHAILTQGELTRNSRMYQNVDKQWVIVEGVK